MVFHIYLEFFVFFLLSFIALSLGISEMIAVVGLQNMCGIYFSMNRI